MKPIIKFLEDAHNISLLREEQRILNQTLHLLNKGDVMSAKKLIKEMIKLKESK